MTNLNYNGAPRPITPDEARELAHAEYKLGGNGASTYAMSRGSDGGYHIRQTGRGQAMVTWINVRRADLRERIMAGKCTQTCFYDHARDRFYLG